MLPDFMTCETLFAKYDISLAKDVYDKLSVYESFLVEYNQNVNLTAITDGREILIKHFLDSCILLKYAEIPQNSTLIDVGTGAGFPSVPIKLMRPDIKLTLLDSLGKRITFLELLCEKLGVEADFVHGRAEDCGKNTEYREKYDFACARAVANIALLSEYCLPLVRVGGEFLAMKGPNEDISAGLGAVKLLGGRLKCDKEYDVCSEARRLVTIKKISQTPTKYPRNSSQIKKKTL